MAASVDVAQGASSKKDCSDRSPQRALITLVVRSLSTRARTLAVDVSLCLPPALQERLVAGRNLRRIVSTDPGGGAHVLARYAGATVHVDWTAGDSSKGKSTLRRLVGRRSDLSPTIRLDRLQLPVTAAPLQYPFDWYALYGDLSVTMSDGVGLRARARPRVPVGLQRRLPAQVEILGDPNLGPFDLSASVGPSNADTLRKVAIRLERADGTRLYVLVLASIPFVLALLLLVTTRHPNAPHHVAPEVLTGLAAALLAVLPIRLVLVPPDFPDLTLVDHWLGFQMSLLAALACLAIGRSLTLVSVEPRPPEDLPAQRRTPR